MLNLIVTLPFLSALLLGLVYLQNPTASRFNFFTFFGVGVPIIVTLLSLTLALELMQTAIPIQSHLFTWINIADFHVEVAFMADTLSTLMLTFISFIATLIHIYAVGYMRDDAGYGKFFSYFNLFLGSMFLLILADNPFMMFVGWELVGLASYLLIGFYHQDAKNIAAANKAFILNRMGDFGFIMGLSILFVSLGLSDFSFTNIQTHISALDPDTLTLIAGLLFVGAMGKSAQIPLYVWLPDAMAGPTPVSALIHAATMVTAGVYMVARYSFLYELTPNIGLFIAYIGAFSALFAALIASFQSDIKKILAYSTMSQLGYMFIAVGLGAYSSGIFHVFTHAFFKALLFMGAGAVIIALHHEQNIFKMGGLKKPLKLVYITMFVATLAISGLPPFAGFFSKDAILATAFASEHYLIWIMASFTALLTAYYMFRLLFTVFHAPQSSQKALTPLPLSMTVPLVILAFGSATAGFLGLNEAYGGSNWITHFLNLPDQHYHMTHTTEYMLGTLNTLLGVTGMAIAYKYFAKTTTIPNPQSRYQRILIHKFYVDELYHTVIIRPLLFLSHLIATVIDPKLFDGFITLGVGGYRYVARHFAQLQTANVRHYALHIMLGVSALSYYLLFTLGVL